MKKILSMILVCALLLGSLGSFSYISATSSPYSGGSGTEEDPYLISSNDDLNKLYYNIETDPALYSSNMHYKLTCDLTLDHELSPLYMSDYLGPNCFVETDYSLYFFKYEYYEDIETESGIVLIETNNEGERFYDVISKVGPLQVLYDYTTTVDGPFEVELHHVYLGPEYENNRLEYVWNIEYGAFIPEHNYLYRYSKVYRNNFYRSAAFTGVFDGNGHTLTVGTNGYLFGYLENGAEIKNLTVKGEKGSFAYSIDETCKISNCVFNIEAPAYLEYVSRQTGSFDEYYEDWEYRYIYDNVNGRIQRKLWSNV